VAFLEGRHPESDRAKDLACSGQAGGAYADDRSQAYILPVTEETKNTIIISLGFVIVVALITAFLFRGN